ncbi:MAG: hypothetical protein OQK12_06995 [Motiliproteus sp.]|nr:hypothetical protein [Motiliproteus sp.]MCW9052030.1 hypothetical protein [Motiliproteus sp.]
MWQKLKEKLFGKRPIEIDHPFFGTILFMGGEIPAENDYWEAELVIAEEKPPITVIINASVTGPNQSQIDFYQRAIADLDALFQQCWPIFEPDFETWTQKPFSGDWRDDFELVSLEIPWQGDRCQDWAVSYYVNGANHYFTARFVDGQPKFNEVDG